MQESLERVRRNAAKCRDLADTALTPTARNVLASLAEQYDQKAQALEHSQRHRRPRPVFNWPLS